MEAAIADGRLGPGARLPPVRDLASELGVSPATVASAYRTLRQRALVSTHRRGGTTVAVEPPLRVRARLPLPPGVRDLASGNPDPALLPLLAPAIRRLDPVHRLYGGPSKLPQLVELATADMAADGIGGEIAVVGGALDGIERVLQAELQPGDGVVVEDPSWPRISDLLHAMRLRPEPVTVDERGLVPGALERTLRRGAAAVIATPRGQNPTGAALDGERAGHLRDVLGRHPGVLVVEDDYVAAVAGAPYHSVSSASRRWAVIRSLSKVLGPDLRVAAMAGDRLTVSRVEGRQLLGTGWVSHLLQQTAAELWTASGEGLLQRAERAYSERRDALIGALAGHGITALGRSGLGIWVALREEVATVQLLLERGWAVSPGERYRFAAPPGIRITTAALEPSEADALATALGEIVHTASSTYAA